MDSACDVVILGGGVIGLTTAYYLARQRTRVAILERGEFGREASWAGAGIIPPGNPDRAKHPLQQLRAVSSTAFPKLSNELRDLTGIDNGYLPCGAVELASGVDAAAIEVWKDEGIAFEKMSPQELSKLEPEFVRLSEGGYYLPDAAQLRNPWHLRALTDACRKLGVRLESRTPVSELEMDGSRVVRARYGNRSWSAAKFLVATGAWADELLHPLGVRLGVHPVRGQMVLFRLPARPFKPIVLQGSRYLVPRSDGRVLAGSTEENAGFDRSTTAEGIAELRQFALQTVPCLERAAIETTWAGLRPGTNDGMPYLGPVPGFENLFVAAGHFRTGIQLSPATGMLMAEAMMGAAKPVLRLFALDRKPGAELDASGFRA